MQKDKKLIILSILIVVMIVVWMPKGRRRQKTLPQAQISLEEALAQTPPEERKRSEFPDWGRDPFAPTGTSPSRVLNLSLSGIIWDEVASCAIINGVVVYVGEETGGKIVKSIQVDKVILTDGIKDYILELNK